MEEDGIFDVLLKKEVNFLRKEKERFLKYFGGIQNMLCIFDILYIVDLRKERNVVFEVRKFGILIVVIVDINCDFDEIDYVIFGNDDVICVVKFIIFKIVDVVIEGREGEQFIFVIILF